MPSRVVSFPFSFFQSTGDNIFPRFPGTTLYTGAYFNDRLILGWRYGYSWNLVDEFSRFPAKYFTRTSGVVSSGYNLKTSILTSFDANFYGYSPLTGAIRTSLTGGVTGVLIMPNSFLSSFTGGVAEGLNINTSINPSFNGTLGNEWYDKSSIDLLFSANIESLNNPSCYIAPSINGYLFPQDTDLATVDFSFSSIVFTSGPERFNIDMTEDVTMNFSFDKIIFLNT